ncbi:MAG: WcaF family extracellular polysaccharide biosynthesis acetyltransferase [Bdellovibrionales bacterium]|nr:WcaF family extracellular polysaccharide biosynthesis acetyltransferase [Bdellovibrionales bacterium]
MDQKLDCFENEAFNRGRSLWVEAIWRLVSFIIFENSLVHPYFIKRVILRIFGASVGRNVLIKPNVKITFPWKLAVADNTWIGERVWLDNLDQISIGKNVCISQGAYLCTGNHNYKIETFDLITQKIIIEDDVWIGAMAIVAPGVVIGRSAVLGMGSMAASDLEPNTVYLGNPAARIRNRD